MSDKLIIKNGNVALSGENQPITLDVEIQNGIITALGSNLSGGEEIDASGLFVLPGGIDPHVHFDDPGYTEREDFSHGSAGAAAGGITTVIDMPCTSVPPVTNIENFKEKHSNIAPKAYVDYGFFAGISGQSYQAGFEQFMEELAHKVMGFKTYFLSGMDSFRSLTPYQFMQVMHKSKAYDIPVLLHAESAAFVNEATKLEKAAGDSWQHYYRSRPEMAEELAVKDGLTIAKETGAKLHIVHLGASAAAETIKNVPHVTGETCPHYLAFSDVDFRKHGSALKTAPVVKQEHNKGELWHLLREGIINFVASDHAPAPDEQKNTGSVWTDYAGIPGNQTLLPYMFSEGYYRERLSLKRFLEVISENAARRYGIFNQKGSIAIGKDADLVLINPQAEWTVSGNELYSKGNITPFEASIFQGRIHNTLLRGKIIYDQKEGITIQPGYGQLISRNRCTE